MLIIEINLKNIYAHSYYLEEMEDKINYFLKRELRQINSYILCDQKKLPNVCKSCPKMFH